MAIKKYWKVMFVLVIMISVIVTIQAEPVDYEIIKTDNMEIHFYKDNFGYNKFYDSNFSVLIYSQRVQLQYWRTQGQGSWRDIGTAQNTYYDNESKILRRVYTDYAGTNLSVIYELTDEGIKFTVIMNDTTESNRSYRLKVELDGLKSGITRTQENGLLMDRLLFDYNDVYDTKGDITTYEESTTGNGEHVDVYFELGNQNSFVLDPLIAIIDDSGLSSRTSFQEHIFFDSVTSRWYEFHINASHPIFFSSGDNGSTWETGIELFTFSTFDFNDFDVAVHFVNETETRFHIVISRGSVDDGFYRRCLTTNTSPFLSCGTQFEFWDWSNNGGSTADDIANPRVTVDGNGCVIVLWNNEDDSLITAHEHQLYIVQENGTDGATCGDGILDEGNLSTISGAFAKNILPLHNWSNTNPIGIDTYPDGTSHRIFQAQTSDAANTDIFLILYNSTNETASTQIEVGTDVEHSNGNAYFAGSIHPNGSAMIISYPDGTEDSRAYLLDSLTDTSPREGANIGSGQAAFSGAEGSSFSVVDTVNVNNTVWWFYSDINNQTDLRYITSDNFGTTWNELVIWQNNTASTRIELVSGYFDNLTCNIMVRWLSINGTSFFINADVINTNSCGVAADTDPPTYSNFQDNSTASTPINGTDVQLNVTATDATNVDWCRAATNNTDGNAMTNQTLFEYDSTPITVIINESVAWFPTTGGTMGWQLWCNDTGGFTSSSAIQTVAIKALDSCSPDGTTNHVFECSDACQITTNIDFNNNNITYQGTGVFTTEANLTNVQQSNNVGCNVNYIKGGGIR